MKKRILALCLVLFLTLVLGACTKTAGNSDTKEDKSKVEQTNKTDDSEEKDCCKE